MKEKFYDGFLQMPTDVFYTLIIETTSLYQLQSTGAFSEQVCYLRSCLPLKKRDKLEYAAPADGHGGCHSGRPVHGNHSKESSNFTVRLSVLDNWFLKDGCYIPCDYFRLVSILLLLCCYPFIYNDMTFAENVAAFVRH